jgi:curved DNA-binding protein CbpA
MAPDYYRILEVDQSATTQEIKKAYRRLAQLHHPDKSGNDPYSNAQFAAIKEAYEILTTPSKKATYLQQRWFAKSTGRRKSSDVITPITVLKQVLELNKYVSLLDIHRMDKPGLLSYMLEMISDDVIQKLEPFHEPAIKKEIIYSLINSGQVFNRQQTFSLISQLKKISTDEDIKRLLELHLEKITKQHLWERLMPWTVGAIVIVVCFLISC